MRIPFLEPRVVDAPARAPDAASGRRAFLRRAGTTALALGVAKVALTPAMAAHSGYTQAIMTDEKTKAMKGIFDTIELQPHSISNALGDPGGDAPADGSMRAYYDANGNTSLQVYFTTVGEWRGVELVQ